MLRELYNRRLSMPDSEFIFSVQESSEGGYEARALGYSIFTQADIIDEWKRNVRHRVKDEVISV